MKDGGAFYGIGGIGALVYFVQSADTAGQVVIAILKAIVWPAFFVHGILRYIGA